LMGMSSTRRWQSTTVGHGSFDIVFKYLLTSISTSNFCDDRNL
jgi:hypothetical protein